MIELIQLINNWQQEADYLKFRRKNTYDTNARSVLLATYCRLRKCILEAELLLSDKHTGAITEAAHLANTVLGEVCQKEETSNIGVPGADSSETGDVGKNLGDFKPLIKGESPCDWDW